MAELEAADCCSEEVLAECCEPVDKEERLQDWLEKGGLMAATSALGTGVDFPGIVFVLHVGMPYGMIDFAQESGRAGRAGCAARGGA